MCSCSVCANSLFLHSVGDAAEGRCNHGCCKFNYFATIQTEYSGATLSGPSSAVKYTGRGLKASTLGGLTVSA